MGLTQLCKLVAGCDACGTSVVPETPHEVAACRPGEPLAEMVTREVPVCLYLSDLSVPCVCFYTVYRQEKCMI